MNDQLLTNWFNNFRFGRYLSQLEKTFLQNKINAIAANTLLQIGIPSWQFIAPNPKTQYLIQSETTHPSNHIQTKDNFLPWATQSVDVVIWPHGMDKHSTSTQTINEINRILVEGGKILLTGFNRAGYWRLFYGRDILFNYKAYRAGYIIHLLQQYNFTLSEGYFLGYSLTGNHTNAHQRIELMGNRWWPHLSAIYALVLEKRRIPLMPSTCQMLNPQSV